MPEGWSNIKKTATNLIYKSGKKIVTKNSQVLYLSNCLESKIIPKCFKITQGLPGNQVFFKEKLRTLSFDLVKEELKK